MEDTSDSCFGVVTVEGSGAEQPSASSERRAVGEAKNADPAEKPLLSDATGTAQSEEGCEQQSSLEQSALKEQEQSSLARWQLPSEGLGNQEVIGTNEQDVFEPDAPFSASSESTSPVTNENYSTSLELRNSEREEQTSQNSVLSENTASGTVTGSMIEDDEALRRTRTNFDETIQSEKLCLDPEHFPGKAVQQDYHMPDVITVRVQTDSDAFQDVVVKIERSTYHKPFLGGFKNRITGVEFHNAGSQTVPKKRPDKGIQLFCRGTQTVFEKNKLQQTKNTTSTQMTKIGLYMSNMTDKLISPGKYLTAEEYHKRRLEAVIVLQMYFRRWHAINVVQNLREGKRLRLAWEAQEELRRKKEKEEKLRKEHERRLNPKTNDDFELLYYALELWRQEETERINRTLTGAERKAAFCGLLEQEAQLIASIGRHKLNADEENQQKAILHFLHKCAQPKRWKVYDGKVTEMDTQYTLRARELFEIYRSISMNDIPKDERIDVLLTLRRTVKHQDLQYMIENIWGCQSALSACSDLYDLVMVRWDKHHEWSPWNTILLTKDEAVAHLKLCNLQKAYEAAFIHRIKHKHIRAKNYFAQIPAMTSFLHRSDNQASVNEFLIATPIPTGTKT
ncbi:IQ and ubiquitin-like domain-containing protein isoform X4 [Harpia harpyja]|uniref:IQ and ubiquitin-like domain-containing protein isoform X4 n=1 Tax=Harpia harpyja TaxID=202280 RepID=UPI0022B0EC27|nr:IQ and ubiquitin-like domain-containing protein isoform X4 [Harpia harpyja]